MNRQETHAWASDQGDGRYRNPVLFADYSDPDVIRVGDDFFMVASSFHMTPGLPVLHSRDLVNWKIVNHVLDTLPFARYDFPRHGEGVWAPSIRYHEGKFWVFFATPDEGIFMSQTEDPFGKWSPLHWVKKTKGWIDPCPFWDDDGRAYLVHAFAKSRIGFKSILHICRMNPDGTELLDEGRLVFDGNRDHPTIEGPKMHKRNGFYYIFAPAGGVATGWQTVLRSRSVYGPYEDQIVLHQGNSTINGPHQGAWVELASGESWFLHFQDRRAYGRITHMQPMSWKNDWPLIGSDSNGDGIGEPVMQWEKPAVRFPSDEIVVPQTNDDFTGESLGRQWQWQANAKKEWYALGERKSHLRLYALPRPPEANTFYETPQILTQKFPAPAFTATVRLTFCPDRDEDAAGLIVLGERYRGLVVRRSEKGSRIEWFAGEHRDGKTQENTRIAAEFTGLTVYFRVRVEEEAVCRFSFSTDGEHFQAIGEPFAAQPGRWVGAQLGIFCVHTGHEAGKGYADFDWFRIE